MEFYVNNGQKIKLEQAGPDGTVNVTIWEAPDRDMNVGCESEYTISPWDFVMMLNWYCYQKRTGNTDLNF